jgi:hypothetical protein
VPQEEMDLTALKNRLEILQNYTTTGLTIKYVAIIKMS